MDLNQDTEEEVEPSLLGGIRQEINRVMMVIEQGEDVFLEDDLLGISASTLAGLTLGKNSKTSFIIRKKTKVSPTIKNLLGEAHLRYARNEFKGAIAICNEIIKEEPSYVEPYKTLSMIFENKGDTAKSLQYSFIAALLDPKNFTEWSKLGEMCIKVNNLTHAIFCYTKAIAQDPDNLENQLKRYELQEKQEDHKGAIRSIKKILSNWSTDGALCVKLMTSLAGIHFKIGNLDKAFNTLHSAFQEYPSHVALNEVNLLLEIALSLKKYLEALQIFVKFGSIKFAPPLKESYFESKYVLIKTLSRLDNIKCVIPKGWPLDLMGKLAIALINLESYAMAKGLTDKIKQHSTSKFGDLYLDIGEAYIGQKMYSEALSLLTPLTIAENYSDKALTWLRYADCQMAVDNLIEAALGYERVVSLVPGHNLAKLNLSIILQKLGRPDDALDSLGQEELGPLMDQDLLIKKCELLCKKNRIIDFYKTFLQLMSRHSIKITSKDDCITILLLSNKGKRYEAVRKKRDIRGISVDPLYNFSPKSANLEAEWIAYKNICLGLYQMERFDLLNRVTYTALSSKLFGSDKNKEKICEIYTLFATMLNGDPILLPNAIRLTFIKPLSNLILNFFTIAIKKAKPKRYARHIVRLLNRNNGESRVSLVNAHISFVSGSYKYAIMEYIALCSVFPYNPLIPLMISSTILHLLYQKSSVNKCLLSTQIMAFMHRYTDLRSECQETNYNMGRILHCLGMYPLALNYYKRVLVQLPIHYKLSDLKKRLLWDEETFDLKREAAYNIALIYKNAGQTNLAKIYIQKYLRV